MDLAICVLLPGKTDYGHEESAVEQLIKGAVTDLHKHFEYLCAQEAAGQLSGTDRELLFHHLKSCEDCQATMDEFETLAEKLSLLPGNEPPGMYARFRARAAGEGIYLPGSPDPQKRTRPMRRRWWITSAVCAAAAVILVFTTITIVRRPFISSGNTRRTGSVAIPSSSTSTTAAPSGELKSLKAQEKQIEIQLQEAERALKNANSKQATLNSEITILRKEKDRADEQESQARAEIEQLEQEVKNAQTAHARAQEDSVRRLADVAQLRDQIAKLDAELSRRRRLSAALVEVQKLIQNPNVRVITLGSDNQGKQGPAFGRAFYVAGQKLLLFVYDLSEPNTLTARSFYVWGDKPGTNEPVHSLGKLTLEDQKDDRWAINLENPNLFSRINEIFITAESGNGEMEKPTGRPMLVTSLNKVRP